MLLPAGMARGDRLAGKFSSAPVRRFFVVFAHGVRRLVVGSGPAWVLYVVVVRRCWGLRI